MANIKGKQLTDSLSVTNVTGSNVSASGLIIGNSGSLQHIDVDNNAVVGGDLKVSQYIKHIGNETTFINFTSNRIRFKAGDVGFADMEKDSSTPYPFTINQGGNRINFRVMDRNTNLLLKTDSEAFNVNLYHAGNKKLETTSAGIDVSNVNVTASGHITASGNISASGDITATNFNGIFIGALSSSAQISSDISGSFTAPSASFSTRVTTAETELGNTLISSSAQIASDISGSFQGGGSNLISGSAASTGSFGKVEVGAGGIDSTGDIVLDGDGGDIILKDGGTEFGRFTQLLGSLTIKVGSSAENAIIFSDVGDMIAGNNSISLNSVSASGAISGSSSGKIFGFASGSFLTNLGIGTSAPKEALEIVGSVSASSSGSFQNILVEDNITATNLLGTVRTATQAVIDHDSLANFVANEHVDHSGVTITAGDGLTGGGTIASTRTLAVGQGTGVTINANDVAIGQDVGTDQDVTFASVTATGNIVAQGDVIAENYIVSSSVTFMTSSFRSGSTISGDTPADDTHQFTGSLFISGSGTDITTAGNVSITSGSFAYVSGSTLESNLLIASNGDLTLDSSGDIILDADGTDIILKDGGTSFGSFKRASSDFIIKAETADKDILFKGTDDSSTITALTLDMSEGGNAQFLGNISGSQIEASGDVIAFGSSDKRLKDNITPIENPLEKMDKIGGYTFDWNEKQDAYKGHDVGVIAQEIEEVLPELVTTRDTGYKAVKYEKIVPLLIESIKENTKKIKELEEEINQINKNCDCLNK